MLVDDAPGGFAAEAGLEGAVVAVALSLDITRGDHLHALILEEAAHVSGALAACSKQSEGDTFGRSRAPGRIVLSRERCEDAET